MFPLTRWLETFSFHLGLGDLDVEGGLEEVGHCLGVCTKLRWDHADAGRFGAREVHQ